MILFLLLLFFRDAGPRCPVDNERLDESQVIFIIKYEERIFSVVVIPFMSRFDRSLIISLLKPKTIKIHHICS